MGNPTREGPKTLRGLRPLTILGQRLSKSVFQYFKLTKTFDHSKPDRAHICTISGAFLKTTMKELDMEPRPERTREVTSPLRTRSLRIRRQRERVVGFEEAPNRGRSRIGRNIEWVTGPSFRLRRQGKMERRVMNLPLTLGSYLGRNEDGHLRDPPGPLHIEACHYAH
ncbi:hypothetical protein Tco_1076892 [Tanacetum coccineum]